MHMPFCWFCHDAAQIKLLEVSCFKMNLQRSIMYSERDMGKQNAKALKKSIKRFQRYIPTMERERERARGRERDKHCRREKKTERQLRRQGREIERKHQLHLH